MRVLVTRPEADAAVLVAALEARGHQALVQPLLVIEPAAPEPPLDLAGVQALLFTSANGVRAFAEVSSERGLPVFAVGDASAEAARAAGFTGVESAGGDVEDLARLVKGRLDPAAGALLHGAGGSLAGDLKGELEGAGFEVRRSVLYKAEPVRELSESARAALAGGDLDAVLFFSPRTAKTFVRLVADHGLAADCERCLAVCLSAAVADNLGALSWRGLRTAAQANQQALLACLDDTDRAAAGDVGQGDIMAQDSASQDPEPGAEPPPGASRAQTVISAFGGIRPMAHNLGVAVSTVQGWKERGAIPANRQAQVLAAADAAGIEIDEAVFARPGKAGKPGKPRRGKARASKPEPAAPEPAAPEPPMEGEILPPLDRAEEQDAEPETPTPEAPRPEPPQSEPPHPEPPHPEPAAPPARGRGRAALVVTAVVLALAAGGAFLTRDLWYPGAAEDADQAVIAADEPEASPAPAEAPMPAAEPAQTVEAPVQLAPEPSEATAPPEPEPNEAAAALEPAPSEAVPQPEPEPSVTVMPPEPEAEPAAPAPAVPQPAPELAQTLDALGAEVSALQARFGRLEDQAAAPAATADQLAALVAAEEALAGRITALEARLAGLDRIEQRIEAMAREEAGPPPTRGDVALMLALEQLREALARGRPYAGELDLLRGVVGEDPELTELLVPLQGHAASGVATRAALTRDFSGVARAVIAGAAGGESDGLMSGLLRRLSDVVTVRPVGDVAGGDPGPVVARTEHRLRASDLAGALAELGALDGPAAEAAAGWRARAEARLAAETALSVLRARAIARLTQAGG
ncbi:MAG: uroporphyrinogen-III synthase [Rhodospirillales bacterium]|nr:uroporphyrinogen-III synthase [Rhodospirillales bacterium]